MHCSRSPGIAFAVTATMRAGARPGLQASQRRICSTTKERQMLRGVLATVLCRQMLGATGYRLP
jgi:hypothetical protein